VGNSHFARFKPTIGEPGDIGDVVEQRRPEKLSRLMENGIPLGTISVVRWSRNVSHLLGRGWSIAGFHGGWWLKRVSEKIWEPKVLR
jgi:hypothetical protein